MLKNTLILIQIRRKKQNLLYKIIINKTIKVRKVMKNNQILLNLKKVKKDLKLKLKK